MISLPTDSQTGIVFGDGIEFMKNLPDCSVDFIFTDPPYGHNNNNGDLFSACEAALGKGENGEARPILNDSPEEAAELFSAFIEQARRVLKRYGVCCCCCSGGGGPNPTFARWALELDKKPFEFKQQIIWDKGSMGMGWHYRRSYETILVAQKGKTCVWLDNTKTIENVIRPGDYGIKKIIPSASQHPTQKPVELSAHFIRLHCPVGGIVLDPFAGSGSTILAAIRNDRIGIGVELDKKFYELAIDNLENEKYRFGLFEAIRKDH